TNGQVSPLAKVHYQVRGSLSGKQRLPFGVRFCRDCAVLDRPVQETWGRVLDPKYVGQFYTLDLLPFRVAKIQAAQVCFCKIRPFQISFAKICPSEVSILQSRVAQVRVSKIGIAEICRRQISILHLCAAKIPTSHVSGAKVRSEQVCSAEINVLEECAADIDTHQRHAIRMEFLQGINPSAAASFSLCGSDALPRLVMLLLNPVHALGKIGDPREQHRQGSKILQNFQECPTTQPVGKPCPDPFNRNKRYQPSVPGSFSMT